MDKLRQIPVKSWTDNIINRIIISINKLIEDVGGGGSVTLIDNLDTNTSGIGALDAHQGKIINNDLNKIKSQIFPLTVTQTANAGTREIGTIIIPSGTLSVTREGSPVTPDSITCSERRITVNGNTWRGTKISETNTTTNITYTINVTQGGQTKSVKAIYNFTNYRYYGVLDSEPIYIETDIETIKNNHTSSNPTKDLSTSKILGSNASPINLAANEYYLFAVKGNYSFTINNSTGGIVSAKQTGTVIIPQENDSTKTNIYSYVVVDASKVDWAFYIN